MQKSSNEISQQGRAECKSRRRLALKLVAGILLIIFLATCTVEAKYTLEGWTWAANQGQGGWTTGLLKGYSEGDCVEFRLTIDKETNPTPANPDDRIVFEYMRNSLVGYEDCINFVLYDVTSGTPQQIVIPAGAITGPFPVDTPDDSYSMYYLWDYSLLPTLSTNKYELHWCAPLSYECTGIPGGSLSMQFGDASMNIGINPGDIIPIDTITVIKDAIPDDAVTEFGFTSTIPGGESFSLVDSGSITFEVSSGTYTITETSPETGWVTSIAIAGDTAGGSSSSGKVATIRLDSGEDIRVTYTNAKTSLAITCPADITIQCDGSTSPENTGSATATTTCPGGATVTYSDVRTDGDCANNYTLTRTWTATDNCGGSTSCIQTITVVDTTAPKLSGVPADTTVECDEVPEPATPTAADNCDPAPAITYNEARTDGDCANNYTLTRTWTATDVCGNAASARQVITVQDTQAPVLSGVPADTTVECDEVPEPATPTAADNCDLAPAITYNEARTDGDCANNYTLTRTWTATDVCGNAASASQVITVQDTKAPTLGGVPADTTVECDEVPEPATPTAADNCDETVEVQFTETTTPGSCADSYTILRTWTATDVCGNSVSDSQTITVQDTQAPELSDEPDDMTVDCGPVPPAPTITATDDCDDQVDVVYTENIEPGLDLGTYTYTRIWTATDDCGNTVSYTQTINKERCCQTAWAKVSDTCGGFGSERWGWSTTTSVNSLDGATFPLYAGAAKCDISKGYCAGYVSITKTVVGSGKQAKTYLNFEFDIPGDCHQEDYHIWLSSKPAPTTGFSGWYTTSSIDVTSLLKAKTVYFAVHSTICCGDTCDGCTYSPGNKGVPCDGTTSQLSSIAALAAEEEIVPNEDLSITCPPAVEACPDAAKDYATVQDIGTPEVNDPDAKITNDAPKNGKYPIGETIVTWTATNAAGSTATCEQLVVVKDTSECTMTAPLEVCALSTGNQASVPPSDGATYAWTIDNGEITAGSDTSAVNWTAGVSGATVLGVTVTYKGDCASLCSAVVEVLECQPDMDQENTTNTIQEDVIQESETA